MTTRYLIEFSKHGGARFLSHLDLQATLEYGMRRAGLPVQLSDGFNPRLRYSLVTALPLGYTGDRELLELTLRKDLPPAEVATRLGEALPEGITVGAAVVLAGRDPTATRLDHAVYRLELAAPDDGLATRVTEFLSRPTVEIEEERGGKMRRRDVRPLVHILHCVDRQTLRLVTSLTGEGSVRPDEILRQMGLEPQGVQITRESIGLR